MTSLQPYTLLQSEIKEIKNIVDKNIYDKAHIIVKIRWENLFEEKNSLSFMELFHYPPLNKLRKSLEATKIYTKKEIDEEIKALSDLPEYKY